MKAANHRPESEPKKAKFHILEKEAKEYGFLASQRKHHPELDQAEIRLVWLLHVKASVDGKLVLGKAIKAPPLWQQATGIAWFIGINRQWWLRADDPQRNFLVDHELCHIAQMIDSKTGEQVIDDHGFLQWRTVKHDISEFFGPVSRHGIRMGDVQRFFQVAEKAQRTLPFTLSGAEAAPDLRQAIENLRPKAGSGVDSVTISHAGESVTLTADGVDPEEQML